MSGFRVLGHSGLAGCGDGMQVLRHEDALYVGHFGPSGMGTTILDVSDASQPRVVQQWQAPPGTHMHKVQVADGILVVNQERFRNAAEWTPGMLVFDVSEPLEPKQIGRFDRQTRWIELDDAGLHGVCLDSTTGSAPMMGDRAHVWINKKVVPNTRQLEIANQLGARIHVRG